MDKEEKTRLERQSGDVASSNALEGPSSVLGAAAPTKRSIGRGRKIQAAPTLPGALSQNTGPAGFGRGSILHRSSPPPVSSIATSPFSISKMSFPHRSLKVGDTLSGLITQANSPFDFWIVTFRDSEFSRLHMPDLMWTYSKTTGFIPLREIQIGRQCIVLIDATNGGFPIYCRASITNVNTSTCDLLLIDYGETKRSQPFSSLYEVPAEFGRAECQAVHCSLAGIDRFRAQFDDEFKRRKYAQFVVEQEVIALVVGIEDDVAIVTASVKGERTDLKDICGNIIYEHAAIKERMTDVQVASWATGNG